MVAPNAEQIKRELLDFICSTFMVKEDEFEMDRSLVDQGVIDSFGLVEISSFLTEKYGFAVTEVHMTRENFGSVEKLVTFVTKRIAD